MKLSFFFTRLDLRGSPSSELRHQKMFNDIQPFSMKPFPRLNPLYVFPNAGSPEYIFLWGEMCMLENNFYLGAHLNVLYSLYVFQVVKIQSARFALSMIKSISWHIGGSDEISTHRWKSFGN